MEAAVRVLGSTSSVSGDHISVLDQKVIMQPDNDVSFRFCSPSRGYQLLSNLIMTKNTVI